MTAVIRALEVSKRFRIGERVPYRTLRETLAAIPRRAFRGTPRPDADIVWALRDVSFAVERGQVVGIIGRNGAGKSTLLKIIARIMEPTAGRVEVRGSVGSLLEVGTGFHPELTGRENVYLNGAILGMKRAEIARTFDEIVAFAEVEQFIDTPVKHFSSGMYLRLAFAVAAHLQTEIVLVDEVLSVGDAVFQQKCIGKMSDVARGGRTVLFVSHNLPAVRSLCSRGIVLAQGRVAFDGHAGQAVDAYLSQIGGTSGSSGGPLRFAAPPPSRASGFPAGYAVEAIEVLDEAGQVRASLSTGDYARFRITFRSANVVERGGVELGIHSIDGVPLIQYSTRPVSNLDVRFSAGLNVVDCEFPRFPLAAGTYVLSVALTRPMVEWLFRDDHFTTFEVLGREIEAGGVAVTSSRCVLVTDHRWSQPVPRGAGDR